MLINGIVAVQPIICESMARKAPFVISRLSGWLTKDFRRAAVREASAAAQRCDWSATQPRSGQRAWDCQPTG